MSDDLDLGCLVTGVVTLDPNTDTYVLLVPTEDGAASFSIQDFLAKYVGQEVRVTVASTEMISKMQAIVDGAEGQLAVALERTPEGHINNCALANGAPEAECQMCEGCPDRHRFDRSLS